MSQPDPVVKKEYVYAFSPHKREKIQVGSKRWRALHGKYGDPQTFRTPSRISKGIATGNSISISILFSNLPDSVDNEVVKVQRSSNNVLEINVDLIKLRRISRTESLKNSGMAESDIDILHPQIQNAIEQFCRFSVKFDQTKPNAIEITLFGNEYPKSQEDHVTIEMSSELNPHAPVFSKNALSVTEEVVSGMVLNLGSNLVSENTDIVVSMKNCEFYDLPLTKSTTPQDRVLTKLQQNSRQTLSDQLSSEMRVVRDSDDFNNALTKRVYTLDNLFTEQDEIFPVKVIRAVKKICQDWGVVPNIKAIGYTGYTISAGKGRNDWKDGDTTNTRYQSRDIGRNGVFPDSAIFQYIEAKNDQSNAKEDSNSNENIGAFDADGNKPQPPFFPDSSKEDVAALVQQTIRFWAVFDNEIKNKDAEEILDNSSGDLFFDFESNTKEITVLHSGLNLPDPNMKEMSPFRNSEYSLSWYSDRKNRITTGKLDENFPTFRNTYGDWEGQMLTPAQMTFSLPAETLENRLMLPYRAQEKITYMISDAIQMLSGDSFSRNLQHEVVGISRAVLTYFKFKAHGKVQNIYTAHVRKVLKSRSSSKSKTYDSALKKVKDGIQKHLDEKLKTAVTPEDRLKIIYQITPEKIQSIKGYLALLKSLETEVGTIVSGIQEYLALEAYIKEEHNVIKNLEILHKKSTEEIERIFQEEQLLNSKIQKLRLKIEDKTASTGDHATLKGFQEQKNLLLEEKRGEILLQEVSQSAIDRMYGYDDKLRKGKSQLEIKQILDIQIDPLPLSSATRIELNPELIDELYKSLDSWKEVNPEFEVLTKSKLLQIKKHTAPCASGSSIRKKRSADQCTNSELDSDQLQQQDEEYRKLASDVIKKVSALSDSECAQGVECITDDTRGSELTRKNLQEDLEDVLRTAGKSIGDKSQNEKSRDPNPLASPERGLNNKTPLGADRNNENGGVENNKPLDEEVNSPDLTPDDVPGSISNEHAEVLREMHSALLDPSYIPKVVGDWKPDNTPISETKDGKPVDPEDSKISARKYRNSAGEAIMLLNIAHGVVSHDIGSVASGAGMLALPRVSSTMIDGISEVSKGVKNSIAKGAITFTKGAIAHFPMAALSAFSLASDIKSLINGAGNVVEEDLDIAFNTGMLVMTTLDVIGIETGPVGDILALTVLVSSRALAADEAVERLREEIPITSEQASEEWRRGFWGSSGYSSQIQKEFNRLRSNERRFGNMAQLMIRGGYSYIAFPLTTELDYTDTIYSGESVGGAVSHQVPSFNFFGGKEGPDIRPCATFYRPRNPIVQNYYPGYLYFTEEPSRPDLIPLTNVQNQVNRKLSEYENQMGPGSSSDSQNLGGAFFSWKKKPAGMEIIDYGQPRYTKRGAWVRAPEFATIPDDLSGLNVDKYSIHSVPESEQSDLVKSSTSIISGHTETQDCTNAKNKIQSTKAVTVSGPSTGSDKEIKRFYETIYQEEIEGIYRDGPSRTRSHNVATLKNSNPSRDDMLVVLSGKVFYRTKPNTMPHTFWVPPDDGVSWQPYDGDATSGWHDVVGPANAISKLMIDDDINNNDGKFAFPGGVSILLSQKFCNAHNNQLGIVLGEVSDIIDAETGKTIFSVSGNVISIVTGPEVCFRVFNIDNAIGKDIKLLQSVSGAEPKTQHDNYFEQVGDCPSLDGNNYVLDLSTAWPLREKIAVNLAGGQITDDNSGEVLMEISGHISRVIKRFQKSEVDVVIPSPSSKIMIENPSDRSYEVLRNYGKLLSKLKDIETCNTLDKGEQCAITKVGLPLTQGNVIMYLLLSKDVRINELTIDSLTTQVSITIPPDLYPKDDLIIDYKSGRVTTKNGEVLFSTNGLLKEVQVMTPIKYLSTRKYELLNVDSKTDLGFMFKRFKVKDETGAKFDAPGMGLVQLTGDRSWPKTDPKTIELSHSKGAIIDIKTGKELIMLPTLMVDCQHLDISQEEKCDVSRYPATKSGSILESDSKSLSKDANPVIRVVVLHSFPDASLDIKGDIVLDVRTRLADGAYLVVDFGSNAIIECNISGSKVRTLQLGEKAAITGVVANVNNIRIQNIGQSKNRDVFIVGEEVDIELNNVWPKDDKVNVDLSTGIISNIDTGSEIMRLSVERGRVVDNTGRSYNVYTSTKIVPPYVVPYIKQHIIKPIVSTTPNAVEFGTTLHVNRDASTYPVTLQSKELTTTLRNASQDTTTQTTSKEAASISPDVVRDGIVQIPQDTMTSVEPAGRPLILDIKNGGVAIVQISQVGAHLKKSKQVINLASTKEDSEITLVFLFDGTMQLKDLRKITYIPQKNRLSIVFNQNSKFPFPTIKINQFFPSKNARLQLSFDIEQNIMHKGVQKSTTRKMVIEPIIVIPKSEKSSNVKIENLRVDIQSLPGDNPWDLVRVMKKLQKNHDFNLIQTSLLAGNFKKGSSVIMSGTVHHEIFDVPNALEGSKNTQSALIVGVDNQDVVILGKGRKHVIMGEINGALLDFSKITDGIPMQILSLKGGKAPSASGRSDLLLVLTKADGEVLSRVVVRKKSPDKSQDKSVRFRVLLSCKSPVQNILYSYNAVKNEMDYKMIFDYGSNVLEINNFNEKISLLADSLRPHTALKLNGISEIKFYQHSGDSLYLEGVGIGEGGGQNHLGIMILHANQWMRDIRSGNLQFGIFMNEPNHQYQYAIDGYKALNMSLAGVPHMLYKTSWIADKLSSVEPLMRHVQNQLGIERYVVSLQGTDDTDIVMIKPSSRHGPDMRVGIVDVRNLVPASIASIKVEQNLVLVFNNKCSKKPIFVVIEGFYNPDQGQYILDIGRENDLNLSELVGKNSSIWKNTLFNFATYSIPSCDTSGALSVGADSATESAIRTFKISSGVETNPSNGEAKEVEDVSEVDEMGDGIQRSKRFVPGQDPKVNNWLNDQGLNDLGLGDREDILPESSSASSIDKGILVQFTQALMRLSNPAQKIVSGLMKGVRGLLWGNLESDSWGDLNEKLGGECPELGGSKLACCYPLSGECLRNVNVGSYRGKISDQITPPQAKACSPREETAWQMVRQYNHLLSHKDGELIDPNADYGDFSRVSKVGEISVYLAGSGESERLKLFDRGGVCALVPSWIEHWANRGEWGVVDNLHSLENCNYSKTFLISKNSDDNTTVYSLYTKGSELPDVSFAYPQSKVEDLFKVANQLSEAGESFVSGFIYSAVDRCINAILPDLQSDDTEIAYSMEGREIARTVLHHCLMGMIMSTGLAYKVICAMAYRAASIITSNHLLQNVIAYSLIASFACITSTSSIAQISGNIIIMGMGHKTFEIVSKLAICQNIVHTLNGLVRHPEIMSKLHTYIRRPLLKYAVEPIAYFTDSVRNFPQKSRDLEIGSYMGLDQWRKLVGRDKNIGAIIAQWNIRGGLSGTEKSVNNCTKRLRMRVERKQIVDTLSGLYGHPYLFDDIAFLDFLPSEFRSILKNGIRPHHLPVERTTNVPESDGVKQLGKSILDTFIEKDGRHVTTLFMFYAHYATQEEFINYSKECIKIGSYEHLKSLYEVMLQFGEKISASRGDGIGFFDRISKEVSIWDTLPLQERLQSITQVVFSESECEKLLDIVSQYISRNSKQGEKMSECIPSDSKDLNISCKRMEPEGMRSSILSKLMNVPSFLEGAPWSFSSSGITRNFNEVQDRKFRDLYDSERKAQIERLTKSCALDAKSSSFASLGW